MAILIRAYKPDDAALVVAFYNEVASDDPGVPKLSLSSWKRFVNQEAHCDGRDFLVAESENRLIGVATSSIRRGKAVTCYFRIIVRPSCRRKGVGTQILKRLVALDAGRGVMFYQALCPEEWRPGASFLEHSGFSRIESELQMVCTSKPEERALPPIPSLSITREFPNEQDVAVELAAVHNRAYAADVAFVKMSPSGMEDVLSESLVWSARIRGRLVGFCIIELASDHAWLDSLAVDPSVQGKGIGTLLTIAALREVMFVLRPEVRLQVSDKNRIAYLLYSRLGFEVAKSSTRYQATLAQLKSMHS